MIHVFRCDGKERHKGGPELLPASGFSGIMWIDLENPTDEEERQVFETFFKVHQLTLEDVRRPRLKPDHSPHLPKVEEFPDYLFVIVNPLIPDAGKAIARGDDGKLNTQLSGVLTHTLLVTHHYEPLRAVKWLHGYLDKHDDHADRGPDFLFHLILDEMVDEYIPVLDKVDHALDGLETEVFAKATNDLLERLLGLKHSVIGLRKTMIAEREVLSRLHRGEFAMIDEREKAYYRNVYDHLLRFTELLEASREMTSDLMQTLLASQANKLNNIMKGLTMISATLLPMTVIAGVYGMNFEKETWWWPPLEHPYGMPIAVGMMAASGVAAFALFRWMKWM